jgi:anhydro-N-acetylmuramic acid kinase
MSLARFLAHYEALPERTLVGLMSGTSADAVTAAAVALRGRVPDVSVRVVGLRQHPIPDEVLQRLFAPRQTVADVAVLNVLVGELFAEAALALIDELGLARDQVQAIASHGQTLVHVPEQHATLQAGEPSIIAERTGICTVAEFRYRDMAAGGQGAPLVPLADFALFCDPAKNRAVQNLGGIANVTWLPAGGTLDDVIAFDTGPGNCLIDGLMRTMTQGHKQIDEGGALAAQGQADAKWLDLFLDHEFLRRPPPKSADLGDFDLELVRVVYRAMRDAGQSRADAAATITAVTAHSIANAYRDFLPAMPDEVIVGGGGVHNLTLLNMLRERLPEVAVLTHEKFGIPSAAKEAVAFAVLANETLLGRPGNVPSATGARRAVPLGKIVPA